MKNNRRMRIWSTFDSYATVTFRNGSNRRAFIRVGGKTVSGVVVVGGAERVFMPFGKNALYAYTA